MNRNLFYEAMLPIGIASILIVTLWLCLMFIANMAFSPRPETPEQRAYLFHAWKNAHPEATITEGEWQALRSNYLLPGQEAQKAHEEAQQAMIMSGMAAGLAAGAMANSAAASTGQ